MQGLETVLFPLNRAGTTKQLRCVLSICRDNFLHARNLQEAAALHAQLAAQLARKQGFLPDHLATLSSPLQTDLSQAQQAALCLAIAAGWADMVWAATWCSWLPASQEQNMGQASSASIGYVKGLSHVLLGKDAVCTSRHFRDGAAATFAERGAQYHSSIPMMYVYCLACYSPSFWACMSCQAAKGASAYFSRKTLVQPDVPQLVGVRINVSC